MRLGDQCGKLTVSEKVPVRGKYSMFRCRCACGGVIVARERHLADGLVTSCGCGANRQKNLAGLVVGEFKIIGPAAAIDGVEAVMCQCKCGSRISVKRGELLLGAAELCGCKRGRDAHPHPIEHDLWGGMLARCGVRGNSGSPYYEGRGITVCRAWAESFEAFLTDMGPRPSPELSIERIDNDGHYSCGKCPECRINRWPANCKWATRREQVANRRPSKRTKRG